MRIRLVLTLALALCVFLRFYRLDGYGLWSDEFVTLLIVSSQTFEGVVRTCFEVPQPMPPLYFLAVKWVYGFFAPGEIGLRVLSAAAEVLAGCFLYAIGRTVFNAEVGLWGLLLFAVNSTQIVYAQNARPYAICLALSTLSMFCFLKWKGQPSRAWAVGYVLSTALLLYTHYIFFPILLIQTLYLAMDRKGAVAARPHAVPWKSWLALQAAIAGLLLPLYPQLWRIVQTRHTLNWESKVPRATDFLVFLDLLPWVWGTVAWLALYSIARTIQSSARLRVPGRNVGDHGTSKGLALLLLWYLVPVGLFFGLAKGNGLNLFVERYLILASLPVFLALPVLAFAIGPRWVAHGALACYLIVYVYTIPATYFFQKGEFSQGVPGGNEWRETLGQLHDPRFQSSLLLFQSPFIESNQLGFTGKPGLARYLAAPLHSFYVSTPIELFVLLPVHWWIADPVHVRFKSEIQGRLVGRRDFTLLATQEFFDEFEAWLRKQAVKDGEWKILESFQSSGALRLKRLGWISARHGSS